MADLLIKHGFDSDQGRQDFLNKLLDTSVVEIKIEMCRWLLDKGATPDYIGRKPNTIMHRALLNASTISGPEVKSLKIKVCQLLCSKLSIGKKNITYLQFAMIWELNFSLILDLARKCPTEFINSKIEHKTTLQIAIEKESPLELVTYLIEEKKAAVNQDLLLKVADLPKSDYKNKINCYLMQKMWVLTSKLSSELERLRVSGE